MKIIKPWIEIRDFDGVQMMKNLELAAKQCYRSQGNITEDSYKRFLTNCLNRGHESVIEHEKVSIRMCCDVGCYKRKNGVTEAEYNRVMAETGGQWDERVCTSNKPHKIKNGKSGY